MLTFRREDRARVARGEITVTFRLWRSAHVKAGKSYSTGFGPVQVDDVSVIPAALIADSDVGPSGCDDIQAIWKLAGEHTQSSVEAGTLLHRVQFRFLGDTSHPGAGDRSGRRRRAASQDGSAGGRRPPDDGGGKSNGRPRA